jgi:hypothetical protein
MAVADRRFRGEEPFSVESQLVLTVLTENSSAHGILVQMDTWACPRPATALLRQYLHIITLIRHWQ